MGLSILIFFSTINFYLVLVYTVLFGFGYGALMVARSDLLARYYGKEVYPELQGWIFPIQNSITASGPWIAGVIYDSTSSYNLAFLFIEVLILLALRSAFLLSRCGNIQR